MRDAAALSNIDLLPWDSWGAVPATNEPIDDDHRALFDHLAALTQTPDTAFAELQRRCQDDNRLGVPPAVHNTVRDRDETI
jgi:hypothetical protein